MDVAATIGAINALTQLTLNLTPLFQQAMAVSHSNDVEAIKAATEELARANDALFLVTQAKLTAAEQAG